MTQGRTLRLTAPAVLAAAALLAPPSARAVFIDDFNGPFLAPHWTTIPRADDWRYDLAGQRLNVYSISAEGSPPFDPFVQLIAPLPMPLIDPTVRVVLGFDGAPRTRAISVVFFPQQGISLIQDTAGATTLRVAGFGIIEPLPVTGGGPFDVRMFRENGETVVTVNGVERIRRATPGGDQVREVWVFFTGPRFAQLGPAYLDHVSVVPSPGGTVVGAVALASIGGRRRRATR